MYIHNFSITDWAVLSKVLSCTLLTVSQWRPARRASSPIQFLCCRPLWLCSPNHKSHLEVHCEFTRSTRRHNECPWLTCSCYCLWKKRNKKKCGNAVSAPPWHGALIHSQVSLHIIRPAAIHCYNSICLGCCLGSDRELESLFWALGSLWKHCSGKSWCCAGAASQRAAVGQWQVKGNQLFFVAVSSTH